MSDRSEDAAPAEGGADGRTASELVERMGALERTVRDLAARLDDVEGTRTRRRPLLKGLGAAGLLTLGAGRAAADPQGRVGTPESPARVVHTERLGGGVVGDTVVADLLGTGLTTESTGSGAALSAAPAANDHVDLAGDFGLEVEDVQRLELTGALSAEDQGGGVVTLDASDDVLPAAWEDADGDDLLEPRSSGITGVSGIDRIESTPDLAVETTAGDALESVLSLSAFAAQGDYEGRVEVLSATTEGFSGSSVSLSARGPGSAKLTVSDVIQGSIIRLNADSVGVGIGGGTTLDMTGGPIDSVGGSTAASQGAIRLANNSPINWRDGGDTADGGVRLDTDDQLRLDTPDRTTDPVTLSAPATGNVGVADLATSEIAFALDENNTGVDVKVNGSSTSGSGEITTYSTERLKANVQPFTGDPTAVLDIESRTFEMGNGDGEERLGITAESAHDAGLSHLVEYAPVEDAWQTEDGFDEAYLDEYGVERDGETLVPNDIRERAWLAMHHELLREVVEERDLPADGSERVEEPVSDSEAAEPRTADQRDRIADLEAAVERKEERIARLEAENERLRQRLAAIERRLGIESTSTERAADD